MAIVPLNSPNIAIDELDPPGIPLGEASLPFDQALQDSARVFYRIFRDLPPEHRDGALSRMKEIHDRIKQQERALLILYKQAKNFVSLQSDAALEIRALEEFLPTYCEILHNHMTAVNKAMEKGEWKVIEGRVNLTLADLESLLKKMKSLEAAVQTVQIEAKSLAAKALEAAQAKPLSQQVLGVIVPATDWMMEAVNTSLRNLCYICNTRVYDVAVGGLSILNLSMGMATMEGGASSALGAAGGLVLYETVLLPTLIGVGVLGAGYGAYCLACSLQTFLKGLEKYGEDQRAQQLEAVQTVLHEAEEADKKASKALEDIKGETEELQLCIKKLKEVRDLAVKFATNKEFQEDSDHASKMEELQQCQKAFQRHWDKLALQERPAALQEFAQEAKALGVLMDSIEPRSLTWIRDDEAALALSDRAYSDKVNLGAGGDLEFRNVRRHQAPARGFFAEIVVAEVYRKDKVIDDMYPALFVSFKGSVDVEWITNVDCAPNWAAFESGDSYSIALHRGYHAEIKAVQQFLTEKLVESLSDTCLKRLVFCGHSHGGALAQMSIVSTFIEQEVHKWRNLDKAMDSMPEDRRKHVKSLLKNSSAVCFASPQILGFGKESDLADKLSTFMYARVMNYVWRCDPVPRCFSNVDVKMLQDCLKTSSWVSWAMNKTGLGQTAASELLNQNQEALKVFRHVSKNVLLCDQDENPEKWTGSWDACKYNLKDHALNAYADALRRFKVRETKLKAFVLKDGEPHRVLWQTRE